MKKVLSLMLALVMCLGLLPATALAAGSFSIDSNNVLTKYNGPGGDVTIPDGVTAIGDQAFYGHADVTGVTIPDGVTSIGWAAFEDCTGLASVTIPDSVTEIGGSAFEGCTGLTSVTIGNNVTDVHAGWFFHCTSLTAIQVDASNQHYTSIDGVLYSKDKKTLVVYPNGKSGAYAIPDGVTSIEYAFAHCLGLTSVTIPDSVTDIDGAFSYCPGLTSVTIPDGVPHIEGVAFEGCTGLTSVTIPDSVTSIGYKAFWHTALTDVYYGGSEAQWMAIAIGDYNDVFDHVTIHCNSATSSQPQTATPTNDKLTMNGVLAEPTVYKIGGGNYFKLRDLAVLLDGTSCQFDVGYDGASSSVTADSGKGYTKLDTDMQGPASGSQTATLSNDKIIVNGQEAQVEAYKIDGGNYFKLRDLGTALGFEVGWDDANKVASITTNG